MVCHSVIWDWTFIFLKKTAKKHIKPRFAPQNLKKILISIFIRKTIKNDVDLMRS